MTDSTSARNVTKFDGTNFQGWKFQLYALFVANEIEDVVSGLRKRPVPVPDNVAEVRQWIRNDAKAKFLIASSMEETQLQCVLNCDSAKAMWDRLSLIHEQKSISNKLALLQKFHEYKMNGSDSVVQRVTKIQNMASQLCNVGETISQDTIMAKILASLTSKFSVLQTAWESVDPERQTVDYLQERLIREEIRLGSTNDVTSAFAAYQVEKKTKKPWKSRARCYKCQGIGHIARECKNSRRNESDEGGSQDCAFVANSEEMRHVNRVENICCPTEVTKIMNSNQSNVWLTDSGASRHLTYRREWLINYSVNINGDTIALGDNGECTIAGKELC